MLKSLIIASLALFTGLAANAVAKSPADLNDLEIAHVAFAKIELDACRGGGCPRLSEHRWRRVDSNDGSTGCGCDRYRHAAGADRKLDQWPVGLACQANIERHVVRHRG